MMNEKNSQYEHLSNKFKELKEKWNQGVVYLVFINFYLFSKYNLNDA